MAELAPRWWPWPRRDAGSVRGLLLRSLANALDLLIAYYAVGLLLTAATGGVSIGFLSAHDATKPFLMLVVCVPVRIALGTGSWSRDHLGPRAARAVERLRHAWGRVPAAARDTLVTVAVVRAATATATFMANLVFEPAYPKAFALPFSNQKFVEIFAAWDSGWYWDIAAHGYYFRPDSQSSVAFFPLYPMLMRLVAAPLGGSEQAAWIAGIAISLTAYFLGLMALHRFTERVSGSRDAASRTVLYLAVFPWSLFYGRVYTEALFLLVTVLAVSRAHEGAWTKAAAWGALAVLTRPNGILVGVPLALLALRDRPALGVLARRWAPLALLPIALGGYSVYIYGLAGDPLAWMTAQSQWDYTVGGLPYRQLVRIVSAVVDHGVYDYFFTSPLAVFDLLQAVTALGAVALTPFVFRYLGPAMGMYMLVSLIVPLSGSSAAGWGRYISVLFPAFMVLGAATSPRLREAIVMVCLVFRTLLGCFFVTWQPIF